MRIAIASEGKELDSKVSEVSGRAPHYIIFDDGKKEKIIDNPFRFGGGGAGPGVASMLEDEKINLVISGKFGDNMISSFKEKGMEYKEEHNITVEEALKKNK